MLAKSMTIEILMRLFRIKMVASKRCGLLRSLAISRFFRLWWFVADLSVAGESAKNATSDPEVIPELINNRNNSENRRIRFTSIPSVKKTSSVVNRFYFN